MTEEHRPEKAGEVLPKAKIKKRRHNIWLWLVPLGALALCGWFLYHDYIASGPLITLYFRNVEGLEEQNTPLSYHGAEVGRVKKIRLSKDKGLVEVKARLAGSAEDLARAGSTFWIVRPEVKVGAISGLRTLITGEYIEVHPGEGPRTNTFVGAEEPPSVEAVQGLKIVLLAPNLGSLQEQSPIFYRGVQVGEVLSYQLGSDAGEVVIRAAIRKEYAPLVRVNSKFWNAGGLNVHIGLIKGLEVNAESVKTLVSGGIEFGTPPEVQQGAANGAVFRLYDKPEELWKKWVPQIELALPQKAQHAEETRTPQTLNLK